MNPMFCGSSLLVATLPCVLSAKESPSDSVSAFVCVVVGMRASASVSVSMFVCVCLRVSGSAGLRPCQRKCVEFLIRFVSAPA